MSKNDFNELCKRTKKGNVSVSFVENIFDLFFILNAYTRALENGRYRAIVAGKFYICTIIKTVSGHFLKIKEA